MIRVLIFASMILVTACQGHIVGICYADRRCEPGLMCMQIIQKHDRTNFEDVCLPDDQIAAIMIDGNLVFLNTRDSNKGIK